MEGKLILASASPRRAALLTTAGIAFEVMESQADETAELPPEELVQELACRKAREVFRRVGGKRVVLGADTVVVYRGQVLGKPADEEEAFTMLRCLSGQHHQVLTGVCIIDSNGDERQIVEKTDVWMCPLNDEEIHRYIASGEPMDKAGAYGIQGRGSRYISRIEGCYFNVVGLPVHRVWKMLETVK